MYVALDDCGGHVRDGGAAAGTYHYHPSVVRKTLIATNPTYAGKNYSAYYFAPKDCWRKNVSYIPWLWDTDSDGDTYHQLAYDVYYHKDDDKQPDVTLRKDYGYMRPCCGSQHVYSSGDATVDTTRSWKSALTFGCAQLNGDSGTEVTLDCGSGYVIDHLTFACYGNPSGSCASASNYPSATFLVNDMFAYHEYCAVNSFAAFNDCTGQESCTVSKDALGTAPGAPAGYSYKGKCKCRKFV